MTDYNPNHFTTTDHDILWDALIGDHTDWDDDLTGRQEAEAISEYCAGAGITQSDDSFEALVALCESYKAS